MICPCPFCPALSNQMLAQQSLPLNPLLAALIGNAGQQPASRPQVREIPYNEHLSRKDNE